MKTLLVALLVLVFAVPTATAQTYPSALTLGEGLASGPPNWVPWDNTPEADDPLQIVGPVTALSAPFLGHTLPPVYEVTYAFTGFTFLFSGVWDDFINNMGGLFAEFGPGTLSIYLDTTPDATPGNDASFQDGELILEIGFFGFSLFDGNPAQSLSGGGVFVGGTWFDDVNSGGSGYNTYSTGIFTGDIQDPFGLFGYVGKITTAEIHIGTPIATEETTWGRVKALYR